MNLRADIAIIDIIFHLLVWVILSVVTFGIALFFFPYSFSRFIINRVYIRDEMGVERRCDCDIDLFGNIGHIILWAIISILTLGLGYVFYFYRVWNYALNRTTAY